LTGAQSYAKEKLNIGPIQIKKIALAEAQGDFERSELEAG